MRSQLETMEELYNRLGDTLTMPVGGILRGLSAIPELAFPDDEDEKELKFSLTQYANMGGAYCPTSKTIGTLPPDCYNVVNTPNGEILFVPQKIVTDKLMRLPDSKSDEVVEEIEKFWTLKAKFKEYGFSHKRGFLLYGPPGSGKTTTISIVINQMVTSGGTVFIGNHPEVLSKALAQFREVEPNRPLVVILEDLDTIIQMYGESRVLSVLDGENQVENVVFIATTNYPENLDGRVINRPSRFDKIVKIGMPNEAARALYLKSKIENLEKDGIDLVKETDGLSIAHIKELIVSVYCQENDIKETLERLKKMKVKPKSEGEGPVVGLGG